MVYLESIVLFSVLLNVFVSVQSLLELPSVEDNNFAITEAVIRNTVNNLFSALKIKDVKHKARLKEYSTVHNFFVSITLKDCNNLNEILRLTRVHYIDNNTDHFITKINEVLDEGDKSHEATEDTNLDAHIQRFITRLREFNSEFVNRSINSDILKHLNKDGNVLRNDSNHHGKRNYSDDNVLLDIEVWRPQEQSGRRIYHGHRTHIVDFPFMASVQFFEKFHCAGSIIQKDLVITAASCLQLAWNNRFFRENPNFLSVQVGCDFYEAGGENIGVYEIYFHPQYNPRNLRNNLAIMRLGTHIIFGKNVGQVKRIEIDKHATPLPTNIDSIAIVGWGGREVINVIEDPWRQRLSFASLDYYPLNDCQEIYSKDYVTKKHFCAGFFTKGSGACNHDVGGPGIAGGFLVGVISFGPPICGTPDAPTVFTKVGFYKDWIIEIMEKNVPSLIKLTTKLFSKESFALHYSDVFHTTQEFSLTPLLRENQPNDEEMNTNTLIEEDRLMKEFLAVMFETDPGIIGQKYDYDVLVRGAVDDVGEETINEGTTLSSIRKDKKKVNKNIVNLKMGKEESSPESGSESEPQVQKSQMRAVEESTKPYKTSTKKKKPKKVVKKTLEVTSVNRDPSLQDDIPKYTKFSKTSTADIHSTVNEDSQLEIHKGIKQSSKLPKTPLSDISNSENDESKLEEDITNLLDDLDLQKLLETDESASNGDAQKSIAKGLELDKDSTEIDVTTTTRVKKTTKISKTNQYLSDSNEEDIPVKRSKTTTTQPSQDSSDSSEVYVPIKKSSIKKTKKPTTIKYSSVSTEEDIHITKRTTKVIKTKKNKTKIQYSSDSSEDNIPISRKTTKITKKTSKTHPHSSDSSEEDVIVKKRITKPTTRSTTRKNMKLSDEDTSDAEGGLSIA